MTNQVINATKKWVETVVIGLNLCPFAKKEFDSNRVRFVDTNTSTTDQLLSDLQSELKRLNTDETIETTLLIHPSVLQSFEAYNQFLGAADQLVFEEGFEGIFQIASFHPKYQFANTKPDDVENYTNRSPYPMLHIIREASLARAIDRHPSPENIPMQNIALLKKLGKSKMLALLKACF